MSSLVAESQALVQNDRPPLQDSRGTGLSIGEEFHGPGFRFVRSFLLVILVLVGCLLVLAGVLSWSFSMDMTVEGQGVIEPRQRHRVKAEIAGIIQQIHVRQGQQVDQGEPLVALVGRSGSGKSTLAKLIPRFYDPIEGYVSIDGEDIRRFQLKSLRQQVGFAMQGSTLFQGNILENLTFGKDIPSQDIEYAAKSAYIHDFVMSLPEGYRTGIGEQGVQLSEGQKQRIALARVLLLNTPIVILDEPTSALDMESESYIHQALKTVRQGRTVIMIAHRISTIQNADSIVVLDSGRIVEQGTHEDLLMREGVYVQICERMASI